MISDKEIDNGFDEHDGPFSSPIGAYKAGARFGSRLERIKTLEEVREEMVKISEFDAFVSSLGGNNAIKLAIRKLDRLIEQAKSE